LIKQEYCVIIHGARDESLARAKESFASNTNVRYVSHDLLHNPTELIDKCSALEGIAKIDILVNNCGIARLNETTMDTHQINFVVPYELTKYVALQDTSKVINVSSGGAGIYHSELSDYCMSKKCLEDMTKHMGYRYRETPIVTCLRIDECFKTDMAKSIYSPEEYESFESPMNLLPLFLSLLKKGSECAGKIYSYRRSRIDLVSELQLGSPYIFNQSFTFPENIDGQYICNGENKLSGDKGKYPSECEIHLLENELSKHYQISSSNIVISHGGISGAFDTLCSQFITEGDEIITHSLCFQPMLQSVIQRGGVLKLIQPGFENGFSMVYHLSNIITMITPATRMIFLVHPTYMLNDTFNTDEFMEIIRKIPTNIPIILDECYVDYVTTEYVKSTVLVGSHLVFGLRTFSKMYGLASSRLGYIICPSRYKTIVQNASPFKTIPTESLRTAYKSLHEGLYLETHSRFLRERTYVHNMLRKKRIQFKGMSMFVVIRVDPAAKQRITERLATHSIVLPDFKLSDELIIYTIMERSQNDILIHSIHP
jgi:histidinol-phosphate aminotransferase